MCVCVCVCVIDIFSKYSLAVYSKGKKGIKITDAFHKVLDESGRKPYKIWVDKGGRLYNKLLKSWLQNDNIEMYSIHNEGKSVVAERFIRTLKNKIYKYMKSISKNVYIDKLWDMVKKYSITCYRIIKVKPVNVRTKPYINFNKKMIIKILKSVVMWEYQNIKIFLEKVRRSFFY